MSKRRHNVAEATGDLDTPEEGDLTGYVIFTRLSPDGPYIYAGWLDAADDAMALEFAREHYGQDQECFSIWAAPRAFVAGLRINANAASEEVPRRRYQIFIQKEAGDQHRSAIIVEASCAVDAIEAARSQIDGAGDMHNLWAIPCDAIVSTDDDDLIWRYTDQTYRLARGYSRDVRAKWEKVREQKALEQYERDELTESF